ncbi:MAG: hypothetical protein IKZ29_08385 [Clostridiales bacterium]|nr:hypothetical protein [Clostridiales bacterium]
METNRKLQPINYYPIDDYPTDINDFIKPYEAGLNEICGEDICHLLYSGLMIYKFNSNSNASFSSDPDILNFQINLLANAGFILDCYIPNEQVAEKLFEAPDISITDLDKAILGWLIATSRIINLDCDHDGKNHKDIFHSFVYFLHNVQRYEQRTKRTVAISCEMNASYLFNILTKESFSEIETDSIKLSDADVEKLSSVLSFRDELNNMIAAARNNEKEYIIDEQNNSDWELFISCFNFRASEEKRVTDLINSDIPLKQKMFEFNKYFEEIEVIPASFNTTMSLSELTDRIVKRTELAPNYIWVRAGNEKIYLDNTIISSVSSPYSFNCVLIAYHAFLIEMSDINIERLVFSLYMFIGKNLGKRLAKQKTTEKIGSIEQMLIDISNAIFDFHKTHEDAIASIKYENIKNEETLSGFIFEADIYQRVLEKERKMAIENANAFEEMDDEWEDFLDGLAEHIEDDAPDDNLYRLQKDFASQFPHLFDDENKLIDQEIGNRLIVSINAIYILVKAMERLVRQGLIHEEYKSSIIDYSKRLSRLEKYLVSTTYIAPDYNCFDNVDMDEYRKRKNIDTPIVELKNNNDERMEMVLFDSVRRSIQILHEKIDDIDFEKAAELKNDLREEIKDIPDSQLKDFIVELFDQECQYVCESLIANNTNNADFEAERIRICDYIGHNSSILPKRAIDALTTAEILFSKYAGPDYYSNGFDYSCISAMYYQAVEAIYNEIVWKPYADELYKKKCNGKWFLLLYRDDLLPEEFKIFLPTDGQFKYWDKENKRITDHLMIGSFNILFRSITSTTTYPLRGFREHVDKVFGYKDGVCNSYEYELYQKRIDALYALFESAKPRRNAASHGQSPISFEECKADKSLVLSDVESVRKGVLGIVILFLSLYKDK